jgi:hypothetical protein
MKMDTESMKTLNFMVEQLNTDPTTKLSQDSFKTLAKHAKAISEREETRDLVDCIKALKDSDIGLSGSLFSKDKVERLMNLSPKQLEAANKVLTNLAENNQLDSRTFDNVMDNVKNLAKPCDKKDEDGPIIADKVVEAYDAIRKHQTPDSDPLVGSRRQIMGLNSVRLNQLTGTMGLEGGKDAYKESSNVKNIVEDLASGNLSESKTKEEILEQAEQNVYKNPGKFF